MNNLSDWLTKQYIDWMDEQGEIKTQTEFAEWIGIDKVTLSRYIGGRRKNPDKETIKKIADKLGPEIYDTLGLARPDPQLQELTSIWHMLAEKTKEDILETAIESLKGG
jgi:transcriptional regulator with XRE-family HTH domain